MGDEELKICLWECQSQVVDSISPQTGKVLHGKRARETADIIGAPENKLNECNYVLLMSPNVYSCENSRSTATF